MCQFKEQIYKQKKGGAIGVTLAGDVANLFMVWWDREFMKLLERKNIMCRLNVLTLCRWHLLGRVDRFNNGSEKEVMEELGSVANGTCISNIQVTIDYPTNNHDHRLPVLDLTLRVEKINDGSTKVIHSHYMKKTASKYVIHKDSAMAYETKVNILTNDLMRIMRNISPLNNDREKQKHIQHYIHRMQASGYTTTERRKVYVKAKKRFERLVENNRKGIIPLGTDRKSGIEKRGTKRRERKRKPGLKEEALKPFSS